MNSGKKPKLTMPPRATLVESPEAKLTNLEAANSWATQPTLDDALNAGMAPVAAPVVESEEVGAGQDPVVIERINLPGLTRKKKDKKDVTHLLHLKEPINSRLEAALLYMPGTSKQQFILDSLEQFLTRAEKLIQKNRERAGR